MVYLFNTKQISRAQAPKCVDDLLQPKWKGKMGMDQDADDYLAALLDYYGDEKGKQITRALDAQQLNIRKGRTLVSPDWSPPANFPFRSTRIITKPSRCVKPARRWTMYFLNPLFR